MICYPELKNDIVVNDIYTADEIFRIINNLYKKYSKDDSPQEDLKENSNDFSKSHFIQPEDNHDKSGCKYCGGTKSILTKRGDEPFYAIGIGKVSCYGCFGDNCL